jgi:SAM-dependent methyltransferase
MLKLLRSLTGHIYDIFISFFFTLASHLLLVDHMHFSGGNFLDVGCGTGKPLAAIIHTLKRVHKKIIGVDLHPAYTEKAIGLFEGDSQVEVYNLDFYKIGDYLQLKFRTVFFSFSFMLMPDQQQALEVAKGLLERTPESRISFALTVNKSRNSLLARVKPLIKRLTTVDFGNVVYEDSFL